MFMRFQSDEDAVVDLDGVKGVSGRAWTERLDCKVLASGWLPICELDAGTTADGDMGITKIRDVSRRSVDNGQYLVSVQYR